MPRAASIHHGIPIALIALLACSGVRSDTVRHPAVGRMASLPRFTLWAWERREDLHQIDPRRFAVAYLDRTLTLRASVSSQPRRDAVIFPASAARIPVVRIETAPSAILSPENRDQAVRDILLAAREPGISALQIDFDATRSQRAFYRSLLFDLRRQMPPGLPLSITALASWCSWDRWLGDLPIDEAVPMMFRMEPDHRRAPPGIDDFRIREPMCQGAAGISTTEPWPSDLAGRRVYLFPDQGWRSDSLAAYEQKLEQESP